MKTEQCTIICANAQFGVERQAVELESRYKLCQYIGA
jgi:hypothetical protein